MVLQIVASPGTHHADVPHPVITYDSLRFYKPLRFQIFSENILRNC
jgi:hypothetical protein